MRERLGRSEILGVLGEGGQGRVYAAVLHGPGGWQKRVALKVLADGRGLQREARLGGLLRHPNLVDLALGPHVCFGAEEDRVDFPAAVWRTPLPTSDPVLRSVLAEHADLLVRSLPAPPDGLEDVRAAQHEALPRGRPDLAYVASRLGVSPGRCSGGCRPRT